MNKVIAMDWITGASLGLLVGLFVGLSTSPIVVVVIGAVVALLAGFFGISEKINSPTNINSSRRIAAFAIACIAGAIFGTFIRTYDILSPSGSYLRRQMEDVGIKNFDEQTELIKFIKYGIIPPEAKLAGKDGELAAKIIGVKQGILYGETTSFCSRLKEMIGQNYGVDDLLGHLATGSDLAKNKGFKISNIQKEEDKILMLKAAPLYLCTN